MSRNTKKWYIEYVDSTGIKKIVPGYRDKRATEQKAAELERQAERQRVGIIDVRLEHVRASVAQHIRDWLDDLERTSRSPEYTRKVASRIKRLRGELKSIVIWA